MAFNHQTGRSIKIDEAEIYYETCGSQHAPPLLLLHGGGGTIEDFKSLVPSLEKNFYVIGIDSRGHGRSTLGDISLTYQRLEQDVIGVLRHLRIDKTAMLGFSDGGVVGYRLMLSGEVAVPKLVAIGAPYELKNNSRVRNLYAKVTGASWRAKFPATYELYQRLNPEPDFDGFIKESVRRWLDASPTGYPGESIGNINGEVLVIRGDEDPLFSRREAFDLVARIGGSAFANIAFAGHAAHQDRPDVVLGSIDKFLERYQ